MDTENTKVAITITHDDLVKALADTMTENEHVSDLVHHCPEMMLVLPLVMFEVWDTLEKKARMNHVANTVMDIIHKEDK